MPILEFSVACGSLLCTSQAWALAQQEAVDEVSNLSPETNRHFKHQFGHQEGFDDSDVKYRHQMSSSHSYWNMRELEKGQASLGSTRSKGGPGGRARACSTLSPRICWMTRLGWTVSNILRMQAGVSGIFRANPLDAVASQGRPALWSLWWPSQHRLKQDQVLYMKD